MTIRTIQYDDTTHKVVPLEPDENQIKLGANAFAGFGKASNGACNAYRQMVKASPELPTPKHDGEKG